MLFTGSLFLPASRLVINLSGANHCLHLDLMITRKQSHLHPKEEDFPAREEEPRRIPEDRQSSVLDLQASAQPRRIPEDRQSSVLDLQASALSLLQGDCLLRPGKGFEVLPSGEQ